MKTKVLDFIDIINIFVLFLTFNYLKLSHRYFQKQHLQKMI
jgi:hypothetical protein